MLPIDFSRLPDPSSIVIGPNRLEGDLCLGDPPRGIVIFAHGSGSSRRSRRNIQVAQALQRRGLGTLLLDLLTSDEAEDRGNVFDIPLLAQRVLDARDAVSSLSSQPVGLFGASTGAAAALVAAARRPQAVQAVVSRGERPDLAGEWLSAVLAPTLLIVGGADTGVLPLNRAALGCCAARSSSRSLRAPPISSRKRARWRWSPGWPAHGS